MWSGLLTDCSPGTTTLPQLLSPVREVEGGTNYIEALDMADVTASPSKLHAAALGLWRR